MKRHSRLIVFFGSILGCVAINSWLIMSGHYRLPLAVLVACLAGTPLIIRKLPPFTRDPQQIRGHQLKAASSARLSGWICVAGLLLGTLNLISGGAHEIPWWGIVLMFAWSGFLIWGCFCIAKCLKKKSAASQNHVSAGPTG
jgi:hypothetical protein